VRRQFLFLHEQSSAFGAGIFLKEMRRRRREHLRYRAREKFCAELMQMPVVRSSTSAIYCNKKRLSLPQLSKRFV
jgi:hypothetical protein